MAAPAQRQQVVQVGAAAERERVHVMGLDLEPVGLSAARATPVEREEGLELRFGGSPDVPALPHGHALGVEHQREPRRPASQPLDHRGRKRIAVGGRHHQLLGVGIQPRHQRNVGKGPAAARGCAPSGEVVESVGHALLGCALPPSAEPLLVGVLEPAGLTVEAVGDATAGDGIELAVQVHHAVVSVPHAHASPSPLTAILGLAPVALTVCGPAFGLLREPLRRQRLGLGQQVGVTLDVLGAGLLECLGEPLRVRGRDPAGLHRVAHRGRGRDRPRGADVPERVLARRPRGVGKYLQSAVAVAAARRHRRRGKRLDCVEFAPHRTGPGQQVDQFVRRRLASTHRGQQF